MSDGPETARPFWQVATKFRRGARPFGQGVLFLRRGARHQGRGANFFSQGARPLRREVIQFWRGAKHSRKGATWKSKGVRPFWLVPRPMARIARPWTLVFHPFAKGASALGRILHPAPPRKNQETQRAGHPAQRSPSETDHPQPVCLVRLPKSRNERPAPCRARLACLVRTKNSRHDRPLPDRPRPARPPHTPPLLPGRALERDGAGKRGDMQPPKKSRLLTTSLTSELSQPNFQSPMNVSWE